MMIHAPRPDPESDPFHPPAIPTPVMCLHCGQEYESYLIQWRERMVEGRLTGFWCCPTPGCGGCGFGFDILPTDPEYEGENGGWVWWDEEGEGEEEFEWEGLEDSDGALEPPFDPFDYDSDDDIPPW